jgi:hypothetical protein
MNRSVTSIGTVFLAGALAAGCAEAPAPTTPDDAASLSAHGPGGRQVLMLDACAPDTGFPACDPGRGQGGISADKFFELLEKHQRVEAWRFSPGVIRVTRPLTLQVQNRGGITHSFTEVEEFGGGFVSLFNDLTGNPVPAPECVHPTIPGAPNPDLILVAPGDAQVITLDPGEEKNFMCCIHPWMRAVAR